MQDKTLEMALLFDYLSELLTDKQRESFDLYYNEDLSLAEIAEHIGISRQGVRDLIVRAEAVLQDFEEKTGVVRRLEAVRAPLEALETHALQLGAAAENPAEVRAIAEGLLRGVREMKGYIHGV
jgi:predicted DNA-binding protein YlxM (UPF0122 family)